MNLTKKKIVFDIIFVAVCAICLIVAMLSHAEANAEEPAYVQQETACAAATEETTEYINETTETETPTEEATEHSIALYDVPLNEELQIHIIAEAESKGIDPAIIFAMAFKESGYDTDAIGDNGNSYGLLQVQPRWHYERMQKLGCTDLLDPYQNVTVAVDYLCELLNRYGSIDKALTAYNRGHYSGTITQYAKSIMAKADGLAVIR